MNVKNSNMVKIAMNKSLLKEYNVNGKRTVYLNDGDEFQLQFFNPHPFKIAAAISFNDFLPTSRKLIINPGERIWLERYLDENRRLCFKTYWVDKGDTVVDNAITNNGKISVRFYKEEDKNDYLPTYTTYEPHIYYNSKPFVSSTPFGPTYYSDSTVGNNANDYVTDLKLLYQSTTDKACCSSVASTITGYTAAASTLTDTLSFTDIASLKVGTNSCINEPKPKKQKETGRVGKGSYSKQYIGEEFMNLQSWAFETEIIYIMPESQKPITNNDLKKKYCPNCGRKLKDKFKFCPFCGEKL